MGYGLWVIDFGSWVTSDAFLGHVGHFGKAFL